MKLKIKNIGPFKEATLNIGDITVIAGVNDTGKSYLSRLIFAMIKIVTSDIESQVVKNFLSFIETTFKQMESSINTFIETNFSNKDKETLLFKEINTIYEQLNIINKSFLQKWVVNFDNKQEKFNDFWINLLRDCNKLLKKNDELIIVTLQKIDVNTNKDAYKIKTIKYTINAINKDIDEILTFFTNDKKDIISYLMSNILTENFHGETLKNKNYSNEDSQLSLSLNNKKTLNIIINANNEFELENDFNYLENIIENPVLDVTYISDTDQILDLMMEAKRNQKTSEYMLDSERLKLSISNIFKFRKCNYLDDFKNKISTEDATERYSNLKAVLIKEKISKELYNYFAFENKINLENGCLTKEGITVKFSNSSRGLKIIEAFKTMINNGFFKEGNLIIIDEPEAYIHPEWQYLFARLLLDIARIVNFKLIVSTHSPYIIETITSLSNRDFKDLIFRYNFINKNKNFNSCIIEEKSLDHINEALSYPYRELDKYEFKWDIKE